MESGDFGGNIVYDAAHDLGQVSRTSRSWLRNVSGHARWITSPDARSPRHVMAYLYGDHPPRRGINFPLPHASAELPKDQSVNCSV